MKTLEIAVRINVSVPDNLTSTQISDLYFDFPVKHATIREKNNIPIDEAIINEFQTMNVDNITGLISPTTESDNAELAKYYIGVYDSDDNQSIKSCETKLIFGEELPAKKYMNNFSWKHVKLPCPHCGFSHMFKRSFWYEEKVLECSSKTQ